MPWLEDHSILIGRSGADHLRIGIDSVAPDNWLLGVVSVRSGPWSGACPAAFYRGELRSLAARLDLLHRDLSGTIHFQPMEPALTLEFSGNGRGAISVTGQACDLSHQEARILFCLELDQTELPPIASALRHVDPA